MHLHAAGTEHLCMRMLLAKRSQSIARTGQVLISVITCWLCVSWLCNSWALAQVLVAGQISQAAVVAASACRNEETFCRQTGITNSRLVDDKLHRNRKVCTQTFATLPYPPSSPPPPPPPPPRSPSPFSLTAIPNRTKHAYPATLL